MEVKNVSFAYGKQQVLRNLSFQVKEGSILTLIGANGCGKSTLFNVMTKNLKPQGGQVLLDGMDIQQIPLKRFACRVAIVHQYNTAPDDLTVEKLVGYGRIAHATRGRYNRDADEKWIDWALEVTETAAFRKKNISALSGGQRQRVWIAMALAQNTKLLFLDEPTTYLDIKYQLDILHLVRRLNREFGITIMMVLHDINQAIHYSDEIIAMKDGGIIAKGTPAEIITAKTIQAVYGIRLEVAEHKAGRFVMTV